MVDLTLTEGADKYQDSGFLNSTKANAIINNATYQIGTAPNNTGHLSAAQIALLTLMGAAPQPVSASVENADKDKVVILFNKQLDDTSTPATTDFVLTGKTITDVAISTYKVTLTVSVAYAFGDTIDVDYIKPVANMLIDVLESDEVASFSNLAVTNNITNPLPVYVSSVIENDTPTLLTMNYDLDLVDVSTATSAFTVLVNATPRTVNSVAIVGGNVQLTLASAVTDSDTVTVAYTKPGSNPLQTAIGGEAASLTAQAVTNNVAF